jgi:hypothetical protein
VDHFAPAGLDSVFWLLPDVSPVKDYGASVTLAYAVILIIYVAKNGIFAQLGNWINT